MTKKNKISRLLVTALAVAAAQTAFAAGYEFRVTAKGVQASAPANPAEPAGDPYFANVTALFHFNGANGAKTFSDSSTTGASPSQLSATASISTTTSKFGGSSLRLHSYWGDPSWGQTFAQLPSNGAYNLGTGDFTAEAWVNYGNTSCWGHIVGRSDGTYLNWVIHHNNGVPGFTWYQANGTSAAGTVASSFGFNLNTWQHLAVSRNSGTVRMFLNGNQVAVATMSGTAEPYSGSLPLTFGNALGGGNGCQDYTLNLNDFRLTRGVGRYTANFTPPSVAFSNN